MLKRAFSHQSPASFRVMERAKRSWAPTEFGQYENDTHTNFNTALWNIFGYFTIIYSWVYLWKMNCSDFNCMSSGFVLRIRQANCASPTTEMKPTRRKHICISVLNGSVPWSHTPPTNACFNVLMNFDSGHEPLSIMLINCVDFFMFGRPHKFSAWYQI